MQTGLGDLWFFERIACFLLVKERFALEKELLQDQDPPSASPNFRTKTRFTRQLGSWLYHGLTTNYGTRGVFPTLVAHLHNPIQPPTFSDSTSNFQPKTATLTSMGLFWDPSLLAPTQNISRQTDTCRPYYQFCRKSTFFRFDI